MTLSRRSLLGGLWAVAVAGVLPAGAMAAARPTITVYKSPS
jgi:hypothetical protein